MSQLQAIREALRKVSDITDDLQNLIPLGTLHFINTPKSPAPGLDAPDGWRWFDPPYLLANRPLLSNFQKGSYSFCPLIVDLCYLIEKGFVRATYREIQKSIVVLRVYAVPTDIEGNRYLEFLRNTFRNGKNPQWHNLRSKQIMKKLITVLNYSKESWDSPDLNSKLVFNALNLYEKFSWERLGKSLYYDKFSDNEINYHIERLKTHMPFKYEKIIKNSSLETRLTDIYNSIEFNNKFERYYKQVSSIEGLNSSLYNYQIESIAMMAHKESSSSKALMPHLFSLEGNSQVSSYLNLNNFTFQKFPEFYDSTRGGILAENMGLGKTLICLSLIIMTKLEISEVPTNFVSKRTYDHKALSLMEQCVRVINRNSISWRNYVGEIPQNCIDKLESQPGFFYYQKDEDPRLETANRIKSRNRPIIREEKLLLSSTTLVVVPDNLFNQWNNEIGKHVLPETLKVLRLNIVQKIPKASTLIKYDLVLMTQTVFVTEKSHNTELNKVYWKRFIIDEGHSMNQKSSRLVDLSKTLKIERRWVVSGTPTSGLTKLQMSENDEAQNHSIKRKFDAKVDLTKLGYLVVNFFNIKPWSTNPELWNKYIVKPLIDGSKNSERSLSKLANLLIVRHPFGSIETDVKLPALFHKPVYLTPSYYNKIAVNLFTAVLALNAVSSEREDKDYMFHTSNKSELRRLVTNLQRSTFYWTGFSTDELRTLLSFSKTCLEKKKDQGDEYFYQVEDRKLLKKCILYCKMALTDDIWRTTSKFHEMTYFVDNELDDVFSDNFAFGKADTSSVFGAPQLYSLQKVFYKNRFLKNPEVLEDRIAKSSDEFWSHYWKELTNKKTEKIKNDGKAIEIAGINRELDRSPRKSRRLERSKVLQDHLDFALHPKRSSQSKILGTASAKLSYMCSRLLEHQFDDIKSIVFYEFEDSAYFLTEALDILGLNYLLYSTSIPQSERFQKINDFTNCDEGTCLIMDLKLASFGLTITAATRVYFLNPVWNRAVEAQAIKRAHRIGQTHEVHVETLILKDTLEEEMFNRRFVKTSNGDDDNDEEMKIPVADDEQIRNFITKFEFLEISSKEKVYTGFHSLSISGNDNINAKKFEIDELLEPIGSKVGNELIWDIPLFSKNAQIKLSEVEMKRQVKQTVRKTKQNGDNVVTIIESEDEETIISNSAAIEQIYNTPKRTRIQTAINDDDDKKQNNDYEGDVKEHVVKKLRFE